MFQKQGEGCLLGSLVYEISNINQDLSTLLL